MSNKVLVTGISRSLKRDEEVVLSAMRSLEYYHGPAQSIYHRDRLAFADDLAFELDRTGQHVTCFDILNALDRMNV